MENIIYILFICISVPLGLMLFLLDKKSRLTIGFMMIGIFVCLFASEVNGLLYRLLPFNTYYFTTTVSPVVEEILKAMPLLFFAIVLSDDRRTLLTSSLAVGIGFAILENSYILVMNYEDVSIVWALIRGFGSGLVHALCTFAIGVGISYVRKCRKLFYTGTYALLAAAIIYHAVYNLLIQSEYRYLGVWMPVVTYAVILIVYYRRNLRKILVFRKNSE